MVRIVLSIANKILLGVCILAFCVCLVYTLASASVQRGINSATVAAQNMAGQAAATLDASGSLSQKIGEALGSAGEAIGGFFSGLVAGGVSGVASGGAGDAGTSGASGGQTASVAQDTGPSWWESLKGGAGALGSTTSLTPEQQAYQTFAGYLSNPLGRVFTGAGVDESVLEGVAAGSTSAAAVFAGLGETALVVANTNAVSYGALVASVEVPSSLPVAAQEQLGQAKWAASTLANDLQNLVTAIRTYQSKGLMGMSELSQAARTALASLRAVNDCLANAKLLVG